MGPCDGGSAFTHAEADFQYLRSASAKGDIQVEQLRGMGDSVTWHQSIVATLLRIGDAALAQYEAANMGML
jgi:hypothetical protein